MYSFNIEQAIQAAALLHQDHLRKGSVPLPYVTHLMSVMLTLRDYTTDEATLVAALLHDTLEDTDYTEAELRTDFGDKVAELVLATTEPTHDGELKLSWREKKLRYAKQLKNGPEAAVMIAAADKAHNFRSLIDEYHDAPERFRADFGNNYKERLDAYQAIANSINSRLKDGIVHEFNHTFKLFTEFLQQMSSPTNHA